MRTWQVNLNPAERIKFAEHLHQIIGQEVEAERLSVAEVIFILTRLLPELAGEEITKNEIGRAFREARERKVTPLMP